VPALRGAAGGILGYPLARVYGEVAELGQRVHWTHTELMNLDHAERRRWLATVRAQTEGG
jgi:hypothetical protein